MFEAQTTPNKMETLPSLVSAARDLAPIINQALPEYQNAQDLPENIIMAMKEAGLHKIYMPKRFGGYELDWGAHYWISREIAQTCGSCGWIAGLVFSHIWNLGKFPVNAQDMFFEHSPDAVLATASAGGGRLEKVASGMRLTGRWGWSSGISHADGLMVIAKEGDADIFTHFCLLLPGEYTIEKSHHVRIDNQFIPQERLVEREVFLAPNPPGSEIHESYVYSMRPAPLQKSYFLGPLLGTAQGALNETVNITKKRVGQIMGERVATQTPTQINIGHATAEIDTATVVFEKYLSLLHARGSAGEDLSADDILWGKRNVTFASRMCLSAADRLSSGLGASGQLSSNAVQRLYTDCRGITTHVELNLNHSLAPTGMRALGLPTGDPLIDGKLSEENNQSATSLIGTQI